MKALILASGCPGAASGHSRALAAALTAYEEVFSLIHYACLLQVPTDPSYLRRFPSTRFEFFGLRRGPLWARFLRSLPGIWPASAIVYRAFRFRAQLEHWLRILAANPPDVVIFEHVPAASLLNDVRRVLPGARLVLRSHDVLHRAFGGIQAGVNPFLGCCWAWEAARIRLLERRVATSVDVVWCISEADAAHYRQDFGVAPAGVLGLCVEPMPEVDSGDPQTVVHLGGVDTRRGHGLSKFVNEGWPVVRKAVPAANLVLAGRGSERFANAAMGISGLGFVRDERAALSRGLIFVNPQLSGSGVKVKNLVALAAGKALVTTPVGAEGIPFVAGEHFLLGRTAPEVGLALVRCLRDPQGAAAMAARGRGWVQARYHPTAFVRAARRLVISSLTLPRKATPIRGDRLETAHEG